MALRSSISLGINLRFKDEKTPYASKEARNRLWWSIFLLEHLITSITGRISGCGEGLSAALLPVPLDEEGSADRNPNLREIFRDPNVQASRLNLTIFQSEEEALSAAAWIAKCEPSPTLLFHCIVDLNIIAQTVINSVYSIQGLRESSIQVEQRLQKHSRSMDLWLKKVPPPYQFAVSSKDDTFHPFDSADAEQDHTRERITLAIYYYSARITLCRPCLSHAPVSLQIAGESNSRASFRASMTLMCLRASTFLLSILPETPDTTWLTTVSPWWTVLHSIMQATTALLIGLSTRPAEENTTSQRNNNPPLDRESMMAATKKAFLWLHHLAFSSKAARRAFLLCESFLRRIGPGLGLDLGELPSSADLPPAGKVDLIGADYRSGSSSGTRSVSLSDGLAMVDD